MPVLAFALQERAQINIWRNRLDAMGLATGPWLRAFKDAILRNDPDETPIEAPALRAAESETRVFPLGVLKQDIMQVTAAARSPMWWTLASPKATWKRSFRWRRMPTFCSSSRRSWTSMRSGRPSGAISPPGRRACWPVSPG